MWARRPPSMAVDGPARDAPPRNPSLCQSLRFVLFILRVTLATIVDKLLARIDVARAVQREVNSTSKNHMCRQWQDSGLVGDARVVEAMENYDSATGNAKSTVDDAYKAVIADFFNVAGHAGFVKIQDYIVDTRMTVVSSGKLFTLSNTIARSSDGDEFLENICNGVK